MTTQKYHPMADYDSALEGVLEDTSRLIIKQEVEVLEAAVQVNIYRIVVIVVVVHHHRNRRKMYQSLFFWHSPTFNFSLLSIFLFVVDNLFVDNLLLLMLMFYSVQHSTLVIGRGQCYQHVGLGCLWRNCQQVRCLYQWWWKEIPCHWNVRILWMQLYQSR